ncbi:MAG: helix-turn-helix domain-containing protein [Bacteroidota bacterium]
MEEYNATGVQILEAARDLFATLGYKGTSTKKIAQAAKVNEVTIFRIFGSKEKLFEVTFEYFFFRPNFKNLPDFNSISLEEFLATIGTMLHQFFVGNLKMIKVELANQELIKKKGLNRFPHEIRQLVAGQFQKHKGLSGEEALLHAVCYMTALHGLCFNLYVLESVTGDVNFEDVLPVLVKNFA